MEYYLAIKKSGIFPYVTWKNLEGIILSERNQTEKDKYHVISLTRGIKKNKWTNEKTRLLITGNKQVFARGEVGGEMDEIGERD